MQAGRSVSLSLRLGQHLLKVGVSCRVVLGHGLNHLPVPGALARVAFAVAAGNACRCCRGCHRVDRQAPSAQQNLPWPRLLQALVNFLSRREGGLALSLQVIDRKPKLVVDGRFWKPIIRPTSGAVETENSLINNELCSFRQQVASGHRSRKEVEKEVLTAACNAVEFASR
jgi:hypothetical protein